MKEYAIIGKKPEFEEYFTSKKELIRYIKDNNIKAESVSQIFWKTYDKNGEETWCELLFCEFQNIDEIFN